MVQQQTIVTCGTTQELGRQVLETAGRIRIEGRRVGDIIVVAIRDAMPTARSRKGDIRQGRG